MAIALSVNQSTIKMQLSIERINSCPINRYGEREYYVKVWHDARKRITKTYRQMQEDEDEAAIRQGRDRRFYPIYSSDILKHIAEGCFWIPPMPYHSKEQSVEWLQVILNRKIISVDATVIKYKKGN
jgi:hypothetical protein